MIKWHAPHKVPDKECSFVGSVLHTGSKAPAGAGHKKST
jgi:hypothetical protein